jgi:hypothetical protein
MKLECSHKSFEKYLNVKFYEKSVKWKPSSSIRTDGRTHRQTDMRKLIVSFRNFANVSKINSLYESSKGTSLLVTARPTTQRGFLLGALSTATT